METVAYRTAAAGFFRAPPLVDEEEDEVEEDAGTSEDEGEERDTFSIEPMRKVAAAAKRQRPKSAMVP